MAVSYYFLRYVEFHNYNRLFLSLSLTLSLSIDFLYFMSALCCPYGVCIVIVISRAYHPMWPIDMRAIISCNRRQLVAYQKCIGISQFAVLRPHRSR